MAISYKLTTPKLGNVSASSLVRSAATLTNQVNSYNDYVAKQNFLQDPSNSGYQDYTQYLNGRINALYSTGSVVNMHKAAELQTELTSAFKTNTTFNIDQITTQMLVSGNTSDQQKLDYLTNNVLNNPLVQSDPALYSKYQNQAYNFQKSIELSAQTQATAATAQYTLNETATKQGYTNAINYLESQYKSVLDEYKTGKGDITPALQTLQKNIINTLTQAGGQYATLAQEMQQTGATPTLATMAGAVLNAEKLYYTNEYSALTNISQGVGISNSPDAQAAVQKLWDINHDVYKLPTPKGNMTQTQIATWAAESTNAYIATTNADGSVTTSANPDVTGYKMENVNGQMLPVSTFGSNPKQPGTALDQLPYGQTTGTIQNTLKKLGFNTTHYTKQGAQTYIDSTSGNLVVGLTDKTAKWMGISPTNSSGQPVRVTLIPTDNGKGFQFEYGTKSYGISLDSGGNAALYNQNDNGGWTLVNSQPGFNPLTTPAGSPLKTQNAQAIAFGNANPTSALMQTNGGLNVATNPTTGAVSSQRIINTPSGPQMTQRAGGGYNFTNAQGQAISAATYAAQTGTPFRTLLQNMANGGDAGAKTALSFVGNDYGYNPNAIGNNGNLYNSLTWGTGHSFSGASSPNIQGGSISLPSGMRL